jgi:hypothetical protein
VPEHGFDVELVRRRDGAVLILDHLRDHPVGEAMVEVGGTAQVAGDRGQVPCRRSGTVAMVERHLARCLRCPHRTTPNRF